MNGLTTDQEFTDEARASGERYVWECAVGGRSPVIVPNGGDFPMRQAVEKAFFDLTGQNPEMCYSGWGRKFTDKVSPAVQDVLAERRRQIETEGFQSDRDDTYVGGELASAGAVYGIISTGRFHIDEILIKLLWPASWTLAWLKPSNRRRNMVKAAALYIAEIERMDRAGIK